MIYVKIKTAKQLLTSLIITHSKRNLHCDANNRLFCKQIIDYMG